MEVTGAIVGVAAKAYKYGERASKESVERKAKIADYFGDITRTLEDLAEAIRNKTPIEKHCVAVRIYLRDLYQLLTTTMSRREQANCAELVEALAISNLLPEALDSSFTLSSASEEKRRGIATQLDEAAGLFAATASFFRIPYKRKWWQFWKS